MPSQILNNRFKLHVISLQRKVRRHRNSLILASFIGILVLFYVIKRAISVYSHAPPAEELPACHYEETGNILPVVNCDFFSMPDTIYFHHTACPANMNSRLACAIESAASANPYWPVVVFVAGSLTKKHILEPSLIELDKLWNINFYRLLINEYTKGTVVEHLIARGTLNHSRYPVTHTKEILRYLTLSKWGGISLDFNTIVAKPLRILGQNWAILDNKHKTFRSAAIALSRDFDVGQSISTSTVRILSERFDSARDAIGARVITKAVKENCSPKATQDIIYDCEGFKSHMPSVMHTVDLYAKNIDVNNNKVYIYRITNLPNDTASIRVDKNSAYAKLAKKYCPNIYKAYGDNFGM